MDFLVTDTLSDQGQMKVDPDTSFDAFRRWYGITDEMVEKDSQRRYPMEAEVTKKLREALSGLHSGYRDQSSEDYLGLSVEAL